MKGQRCYVKHEWGDKGITNAIGGLIAIGLLTGYVNTDVFTCWVDKTLLPNLPDKSVIFMNNTTFHKGAKMRKLIEDSGHI